ncbi:hypothetical protein ACP70R_007407 [Stipagrostis hirtigluma subsp. patula]
MKITVESSKVVKPAYVHGGSGGASEGVVPLTVFDKVTYDQYISGINFFRPPGPPTAMLEAGLARALAEYREWAGRLGVDAGGDRAIMLNDAGARFVEATADVALSSVMPLETRADVLSLHPSGGDGAEELMLVQVTRFTCGSVAVGHTMHHAVGDGHAASNCLLAWGQATRGAAVVPVPEHDRASYFVPRQPPRVEFEHRGAEFKPRGEKKKAAMAEGIDGEKVVVERVHFSKEFVSELKSRASPADAPRPYSTLQCVTAHLWRCITKARGLDGRVVTTMRVAVDGRARMRGRRVPEGYTGNAVLWARPSATARELVAAPLRHAVELIGWEVARIDDGYFRSFIDFASSGAVEEERLAPAADAAEKAISPDVEVDSLLHFPFCDLDFGGGRPFYFMPSYLSEEGFVFVVRSFSGDRSVDAYVTLFSRAADTFKQICYSMAMADARL